MILVRFKGTLGVTEICSRGLHHFNHDELTVQSSRHANVRLTHGSHITNPTLDRLQHATRYDQQRGQTGPRQVNQLQGMAEGLVTAVGPGVRGRVAGRHDNGRLISMG